MGFDRKLKPICHWRSEQQEGPEIVYFDYDCPLGPDPYPENAPTLLENWFGAFRREGYLRNVSLLDFSLPGTHDRYVSDYWGAIEDRNSRNFPCSLSYDLSLIVSKEGLDTFGWLSNILHALSGQHLLKGELENFFRMQAKTQQLTISQQLDNGIRFLDIRLMYEGAWWYSIHFMQSKQLIMEYFIQIKNWMVRHPDEIVVMWLSRHGNTRAKGESQYPNVPVHVRQELWQRLTVLFDGMLYNSKICNISTDSIEHLLNNNCRVVPFVSDYALFTGRSEFALDAARIINSWDTKGGIFNEEAQKQEHCAYFDQIRRHKARSKGSFTLRGMNSQSNRPQILHAAQRRFLGWAVNFHCKLKGMNATKWCPDTLLDIAQLSSYYNQRSLDSARDFPHAFYLDALDYNGTIRTGSQLLNGASHGGELPVHRYAYVDALLSYNLRKIPDLPSNCNLCFEFERRRRYYPLSSWLEIPFGRYTNWPSDCISRNPQDDNVLFDPSSKVSPI